MTRGQGSQRETSGDHGSCKQGDVSPLAYSHQVKDWPPKLRNGRNIAATEPSAPAEYQTRAERPQGQRIGGGVPSTLAGNAGSHSHTRHRHGGTPSA